MDDHMTKAKLLETLESKRAEWDAALAEVPADHMTEPGVAGEWSVKDIIAHMTYHERWIGDRLREQLGGEVYVPTQVDFMPYDERNDLIFQHNRSRPLPDVMADSRQAHQLLIDGVKAHSEEFLIEPQHFEGAPQPVTVWKLLRGDVYEHYGPHISSIKAWLASRQTGSSPRRASHEQS